MKRLKDWNNFPESKTSRDVDLVFEASESSDDYFVGDDPKRFNLLKKFFLISFYNWVKKNKPNYWIKLSTIFKNTDTKALSDCIRGLVEVDEDLLNNKAALTISPAHAFFSNYYNIFDGSEQRSDYEGMREANRDLLSIIHNSPIVQFSVGTIGGLDNQLHGPPYLKDIRVIQITNDNKLIRPVGIKITHVELIAHTDTDSDTEIDESYLAQIFEKIEQFFIDQVRGLIWKTLNDSWGNITWRKRSLSAETLKKFGDLFESCDKENPDFMSKVLEKEWVEFGVVGNLGTDPKILDRCRKVCKKLYDVIKSKRESEHRWKTDLSADLGSIGF